MNLTGEGGLNASNRWNRRGRPLVYLAQTAAGVLLEYLVHLLENTVLPDGLELIHVDYPDTLAYDEIDERRFADDWLADLEITRNAGDNWLQQCGTALLSVPSVIAPSTRNFLLNPKHPDAGKVTIREHFRFDLDPRLKQLADYAISYREEIRYVFRDE